MPLAAIYPGTFDPITNGHIDLAERGARLFDRLVVSIAASPNKQPLFTLEERIHLAQTVLAHVPNVEVQGFSSLLVEHARTVGARVLLRGLRAVSDFEFEFQLASTNRRLDAGIETVFLTPTEQHTFISSSIVREVAKLGGSVDTFVHPLVQAALREKWGH